MMIFKRILLSISIFFIISCDLGLTSGDDLIGTWIPADLVPSMGGPKKIIFKSDFYYYVSSLKTKKYSWCVSQGAYYKVIKYTFISETTDDAEFDGNVSKDEYYFSVDKNYLYLRTYKPGSIMQDNWRTFKRK